MSDPLCNVKGFIRPRAFCSSVRVGQKHCSLPMGQCPHQRDDKTATVNVAKQLLVELRDGTYEKDPAAWAQEAAFTLERLIE